MLIALISGLLCLFSKLSYIVHYLLYVFPVVLFILSGGWFKIIILLCGVTLAYDMIKLLETNLVFVLSTAVNSIL